MKKIKKIVAGALAAALTLSLGGIFMGCNSGVDYTFEAEDAVLEGGQVENDKAYKINGELVEDDTLSGVGTFSSPGNKMTWTIVASADCKATLTLYAASALMNLEIEGESSNPLGIHELDLGATEAYKLTCNDEEAKLTGKLPGATWENGWADMGADGAWWNIGTAVAKINLKKGTNTIVFEIVANVEGQQYSAINIDKIVINASAELTAGESAAE